MEEKKKNETPATKKKIRCMCKKKCKGVCKKQKAKDDSAKAQKSGPKATEEVIFPGRSASTLGSDNLRDIHISGFNLSNHGMFLLEDAELHLAWGQKYGLLGRNGVGKSTLMKAIAARDLEIPSNLMVILCDSEVDATDNTALQQVVEADLERTYLLEKEKKAIDDGCEPEELEKIHERLTEIEAETAEARSSQILAGLGFTPEMQNKKCKDFSGGWRMRISIAQSLMLQPDILLLDEPTNHLDLEACLWLEAYLQTWDKVLMVVSHAQDFLNSVCDNIILFKDNRLKYYGGNYDTYYKTREEEERRQLKQFKAEQEEIRNIKDFVNKFGHGTRASQAKSRIKAMNKMVDDGLTERPNKEKLLSIYFPDPVGVKGSLIMFTNCSFKYTDDGPLLYHDLDFNIDMNSRIALVGPNGVGKSTLLKLISGDLQPTAGTYFRHGNCKVAKFHQHFIEQLDMKKSPIKHMEDTFGITRQEQVRAILGRFGLQGKEQTGPMGRLSGGQKSRVVFAHLALEEPTMLLLDEPTNHLDMETIDSLSIAINAFEGPVVVVSHDTRLIYNIADHIWLVDNKTIKRFDGDIMAYRKKVIEEKGLELEA
mmetsp:Transcript_57432/g.65520  ORF Transcript_57432/g.65520 Transcript_57432/m.65520 type:complete len:596 (-) Transcript_57432:302-2089(-)